RSVLCFCCWLSVTYAAKSDAAARFAYADVTKPEFFPILPWDPYHGWSKPWIERRQNGLESLAECHFNMAGFVFPKDLGRCEKLGLGAILLPSDRTFTNLQHLSDWKNLSEREIEGRVNQMIRAAGHSPAVMGYFIMDEPGVSD